MLTRETQMHQQEIFQTYRALLFSIAYRMLGSVMDAEDCMQEAFLQWHDAVARNQTIENPKAYLCTLVTRRCIDRLRSAQAQRETYVGLWLPEPLIETTDPSDLSELSESLSIAFLLLLERLSPIERAVFLLRQIFDYDYAEIATIVGKSAENCRQVMHRARRHLPTRNNLSQSPTIQQQQILNQFLQACMSGDTKGLLHLLSDEAVLHTDGGGKVNTSRNPLYGADRVARYLVGVQRKWPHMLQVLVARPTLINGQLGLIGYLKEHLNAEQPLKVELQEAAAQPFALHQRTVKKGEAMFVMVPTFANDQIQQLDIIINPEKLRHIPALAIDDDEAIV